MLPRCSCCLLDVAHGSRSPFQGPRAQIDRKLYKRNMQDILNNYPNLEIRSASVKDVVLSEPVEGELRRVVGLRIGALASFYLSDSR